MLPSAADIRVPAGLVTRAQAAGFLQGLEVDCPRDLGVAFLQVQAVVSTRARVVECTPAQVVACTRGQAAAYIPVLAAESTQAHRPKVVTKVRGARV